MPLKLGIFKPNFYKRPQTQQELNESLIKTGVKIIM